MGEQVPKQNEILEISTLGGFEVKLGPRVLTDEYQRSRKSWDLLKFLLLHREKYTPAEEILEQLWPQQEYTDHRRALRIQVHRLRQMLEEQESNDPGGEPPGKAGSRASEPPSARPNYLVFSHGCYRWNQDAPYWLDVEEFASLYQEAYPVTEADPPRAEACYRRMLELYKGELLPENSYSEWVIPIRNYYRHIFLKSALELLEILKRERRCQEIVEVGDKVLQQEFFEEEFHAYYLEALLELGKAREAKSHYHYLYDVFQRELEAQPSEALTQLYHLAVSGKTDFSPDLKQLQQHLLEKDNPGIMFCSPESFRLFYQLERRRCQRNGSPAFLVLVTLSPSSYRTPGPEKLRRSGEKLQEVFSSTLRRGDVFTWWSESQYLVLLVNLRLHQAETVLQRLEEKFTAASDLQDNLQLKIQIEPLL